MKFMDDLQRWRGLMDEMRHAELAALALEESGYLDMWKMNKSPEAPGRLENLKELVSAMQEYDSLQEFLEHVALVLENQNSNDSEYVSVMTLHRAKGLEFDAVFLPGWEEGLFPSKLAILEGNLEEERRLAYVGITRARKKAYISYVANRYIYGNSESHIPSRFVEELPGDHVNKSSDIGIYSGGRSSHWDSA